ncbi:MAG: glycosyltransferase family 2 protein [Candidatus Bathyarchaeota archaeon]|nr:glycosyltransferase family 2 protein [Candidatus Bathyarchaeota archaeon]
MTTADLRRPSRRGRLFPDLTIDRYNETISGQLEKKTWRNGSLCALTAAMTLLSSEGMRIADSLDLVSNVLKANWLIPLPYFVIQTVGFQRGLTAGLLVDVDSIRERGDDLEGVRIIYTVTTKGENLATLRDTVESTLYWTGEVKRRHGLRFASEVWVVTEEGNYAENPEFYADLEEMGAIVVATPSKYETPLGSRFKTRALQYAADLRRDRGIDGDHDWVYHQDTETMIGEDTVLGNLDFVLNADSGTVAGSGIILYPQGWGDGYTNLQETTRSFADLSAAGQANLWGWVPFGYHGSHILIRADAEAAVGWDYGRVRSEDLLFSVRLRERFGRCIGAMKGFAYEKPPFTVRDHLKQRRRWILGSFEVLGRGDVGLRKKAPIIYSAVSWLSALPSLAATIFTLVHPSGGFIPYLSGAFTGLVWWSLFNSYMVGYELHRGYTGTRKGMVGFLRDTLVGMAADATAPWYALLSNTRGYEEISKDTPPVDDALDDESGYEGVEQGGEGAEIPPVKDSDKGASG